jgi:hypothetical protein
MKFFVPRWVGDGKLRPRKAERVWSGLNSSAAVHYGAGDGARVYRLSFERDGELLAAEVGGPAFFDASDTVVAIIAVCDGYVLCTRYRGHRIGGMKMPVPSEDVRNVEFFEA